jgi:SpoVK/Ycf46/Vps4 family AAA+-type ATPase
LSEIENIKENVFVIAGTSKPELISKEFMKSGLLDQFIEIFLPDYDSRVSILKICCRKLQIAKDVDLNYIAEICDGYTGYELNELIKNAFKIALSESINDFKKKKDILIEEEEEIYEVDDDMFITKKHFAMAMEMKRVCKSEKEFLNMKLFAQEMKVFYF